MVPLNGSYQSLQLFNRTLETNEVSKRIKVLYIAGTGRCGSTILDLILGRVSGYFSVGEINMVWERGFVENRLCTCGARFLNCETWRNILEAGFQGSDGLPPVSEIAAEEAGLGRARHLPFEILSGRGRFETARPSSLFLSTMERLYTGVQAATGCNVIVDSSKRPGYAYALSLIDSIDLWILHLVRDPRAVTFSFSRPKRLLDVVEKEQYMRVLSPVRAATMWLALNLMSERLRGIRAKGYLRLTYEELVADPKLALGRIFSFIGDQESESPIMGQNTLGEYTIHNMGGNPMRLTGTAKSIKSDEQWRKAMPLHKKMLVSLATLPLLLRYEYPLIARS